MKASNGVRLLTTEGNDMSLNASVKAVLKGIKSEAVEVIFDDDMPGGINLKATVEEKSGPSTEDMLDIMMDRFEVDGDHILYKSEWTLQKTSTLACVTDKFGTHIGAGNENPITILNVKLPPADVAWAVATGSLVRDIQFKDGELKGEDKFALSNLITPEGDELDSKPKKAKKEKKANKKSKKSKAVVA